VQQSFNNDLTIVQKTCDTLTIVQQSFINRSKSFNNRSIFTSQIVQQSFSIRSTIV